MLKAHIVYKRKTRKCSAHELMPADLFSQPILAAHIKHIAPHPKLRNIKREIRSERYQ